MLNKCKSAQMFDDIARPVPMPAAYAAASMVSPPSEAPKPLMDRSVRCRGRLVWGDSPARPLCGSAQARPPSAAYAAALWGSLCSVRCGPGPP